MNNLIKKVNKIARKDGRQTKTPTNLSLEFLEQLSRFLKLILKKKITNKELVVLENIKEKIEAISIRITKMFTSIKKKILIKKKLKRKKFNHKFLSKEKCGNTTIAMIAMMKNTMIIIMIIIMKMATTMTLATMIITTTIIMSLNIM